MASEIVKRALYGAPKVGGDCLSYCTRCKMELAHVIVAMVDSRPLKVLCKTCRTQHNYRKSEGAPAARASSGTSTPRAARVPVSVIRVAELWEKKLAASNSVAQPYATTRHYKTGDIIQHTKFGMGLIEDAKSNGKITVLFRDGEKVLIHAGAPTNAPGA